MKEMFKYQIHLTLLCENLLGILRHSAGCSCEDRNQEKKYQACMKERFVFWAEGDGKVCESWMIASLVEWLKEEWFVWLLNCDCTAAQDFLNYAFRGGMLEHDTQSCYETLLCFLLWWGACHFLAIVMQFFPGIWKDPILVFWCV